MATNLTYLLRRRLLVFVALGAAVVLLAGGAFAAFEDRAVSSYAGGLYWALSLMTTVGFVGSSPASVGGQVVAAVLMVSGFAMLTLVTAAISSLFVREQEEPELVEESGSRPRRLRCCVI